MKTLALVLVVALAIPGQALAQNQPEVWRGFAGKLEAGAEVTVKLRDGKRFRAVFIDARDAALVVQPKTRIAVPAQEVPYDAIVSIERRQPGGMSGAKAAGIGVASGAATFLGILLVLFAAIDD